jgi:predicted ATP-grasp superfamily ATP-dependent carboligase
LPRNSQAESPSLLLAAVSARALAQSARRAGFTPLVADFFADTDTQAAAYACRKLGGLNRGMRRASLLRALEALAARAPSPILGIVCGAGFEDRAGLLQQIAERWPLLGNEAATVGRLKSPKTFFAELDRLGIPHPETCRQRPAKGDARWLAKKTGGAGGSHIVPGRLAGDMAGVYFQERVVGRAISGLFVANGSAARVLGFSEQWTAPRPGSPWRYGGAVRPATIDRALERQMISAISSLVRSFGIKGLASADFLVRDEVALLLEINPRPGATLDIFDCGATPLLRLHVDAVRAGKLPPRRLNFEDAMASAIVYAVSGGAAPPGFVWPEWSADRPKPSERIDKNRPICTVVAHGSTKSRAKRLVEERTCKILSAFQSVSRGDNGEQKGRNRRSARDCAPERQRQGGAARQGAHR